MADVVTALGWLSTVAGFAVVVLTLRDVFHTLWHASGEGRVSRGLARVLWGATGRLGTHARDVAGPLLLVSVVACWAVLVVVGGALVYLPAIAGGGFAYSSNLDPATRSPVVDALYVSTVGVSTLGFGDLVPRDGWLRLLAGAQALLGFSLLTAGVSWVLQVQATLVRRRTTARFLVAVWRTRADGAPPPGDAVLAQATERLANVHVDLGQTAPSYYFRDQDAEASLAWALHAADDLASRARGSDDDALRAGGAALDRVVDELAALLGRRFVRTGGDGSRERADLVRRLARDHGHPAPGA
ncbi:potassium channel family protein [Actinotalea sp. AC32]|nr:potassium channel family protein [Actinotalea sp. AC32]